MFPLTILIMVCNILNDHTFINCKVERRCVGGLCGKFVWTCILSSIIFEILVFYDYKHMLGILYGDHSIVFDHNYTKC